MLKLFYRTGISLLLSSTATSVFAVPVLMKNTTPGFIMPEAALYTTCILDDEGFLITRNQLSGLSSRKTTPLQASFTGIKQVIAEAAKSNIEQTKAIITDVPSATYYAYQKKSNGTYTKVTLIQDNGSIYQSVAAAALRNFMDAICK